MLRQAEHDDGERARARSSTAAMNGGRCGDNRTGRSGVERVLESEGGSRRKQPAAAGATGASDWSGGRGKRAREGKR
jgi:hypothetical protein